MRSDLPTNNFVGRVSDSVTRPTRLIRNKLAGLGYEI